MIVGFVVTLVALFFTEIKIYNIFIVISVVLMTSAFIFLGRIYQWNFC